MLLLRYFVVKYWSQFLLHCVKACICNAFSVKFTTFLEYQDLDVNLCQRYVTEMREMDTR
jgi:hypothetical protein